MAFCSKTLSLFRMKIAAAILFITWCLLLLEPLSANLDMASNYSSCAGEQETGSSCCSSSCELPAEEEEEEDCTNNRCNPLMSCPTGNFYLSGHSALSIDPYTITKTKAVLVNDNRIVKQHAECWHPPEII